MNREFRSFLGASVILFVIRLVMQWPYLGDLVVIDDNMVLPLFMAGETMTITGAQLMYFLFGLIAGLESVTAYKILMLVIYAANTGLIAVLLVRYVPALAAVLFSLAVMLFPPYASQVVFVTGSHPSLALFFLLALLLLFDRTAWAGNRSLTAASLVGLLLVLGAAYSSPVALIAVGGLPLMLIGLWWLSRKQTRRPGWLWLALLVGTSAAIAAVYIATGQTSTQYNQAPGLFDLSAAHIVSRLFRAAEVIVAVYQRNPGTAAVVVGGLVTLAGLAVFHWWNRRGQAGAHSGPRPRSLLLIVFGALILSALSFGPVSIATRAVHHHYLVVPTTLFLVAVCAFVLYAYRFPMRGGRYTAVLAGLGVIIAANSVHLRGFTDVLYADFLETHQAVSAFVRQERHRWPEDAQVALFLNDDHRSTTFGYNHWSTWYLRMLTENKNVIGLVGTRDMITHWPFVITYQDLADEYWLWADGRKIRRVRMKGLEYDRPLFVYEQDENGGFQPAAYTAFTDQDRGGVMFIGFGQSYIDARDETAAAPCWPTEPAEVLQWIHGFHFESRFGPDDHVRLAAELSFHGEEQRTLTVDIPAQADFRVGLRLSDFPPVAEMRYDDTNPPMPALAPAFALYQHPDGMLLHDRRGAGRWVIPAQEGTVDIFFERIHGCMTLVGTGDTVLGLLVSDSVSGDWTLGIGYRERYWTGTIEEIYAAFEGAADTR